MKVLSHSLWHLPNWSSTTPVMHYITLNLKWKIPKHFRQFANTNNFKTLEMRRIKETLVWFWGFAGNFMTSQQSAYIHIMHIVKKEEGLYFIVASLLRDDSTVRNRLNRPPTRRDCDNVWAPLKFNDCLAWPLQVIPITCCHCWRCSNSWH